MMRLVRWGLILSPALVLAVVAGLFLSRGEITPAPTTPPAKLVVLVVFDQFREDYLDRWSSAFGQDGLARLQREGVWYDECHVPYACTSTAPGHASLITGAPPAVHGIVENQWFLRGSPRAVSCVVGVRPYERIPALSANTDDMGLSPEWLLVPTVGDALRAEHPSSRVISLSLKDRGAVLLGGKNPTGAYCFDSRDGLFHTSSYYREAAHPWVEQFNAGEHVLRWSGKTWDRLGAPEDYDRLAGPDDVPGEGIGADVNSRVFPHPLPEHTKNARGYFRALEQSPFGNELIWALAREAIVHEGLGKQDATDLLLISFSANDLIGHAFGPDSHEVLDVTLRSDRLVAEMLHFLDEHVGPNRYALVVTSDHGVCHLPERQRAGEHGLRIPMDRLVTGIDEALDETFGRLGETPGRWLAFPLTDTFPWVHLNHEHLQAMEIPPREVERYLEQWLGNRPHVMKVLGRGQLTEGVYPAGSVEASMQQSYYPDRCGDLMVVLEKNALPAWYGARGTNHGTPHRYDTHVPLLAAGAGVPKRGRQSDPVSLLAVAPLLSQLLGITPPALAREPLPEGW